MVGQVAHAHDDVALRALDLLGKLGLRDAHELVVLGAALRGVWLTLIH